ncbi:MAG: hypothetical protein V2G48_05145 [bacterium JZ-2024 1]
MLYILEYRRPTRSSNFEFAGIITVSDNQIIYRYKPDYEEIARKELDSLPADLVAISRSGDDILVNRKSVIYSEESIDVLFEEFLGAEKMLRRRRLLR